MSQYIGEKKLDQAGKAIGSSIALGIVFIIAFNALGSIFRESETPKCRCLQSALPVL